MCRKISSVTQKYIVAVTGIILCLFVLVHVSGNMLLFVGPEAFNKYSHMLIHNPFIYFIEGFLLFVFITHIFFIFLLTLENIKARPRGYKFFWSGEKTPTLASRTMIYHGSLILVFLILHLISFKYGPYYEVVYDGVAMRDIFKLVVEGFTQPHIMAFYLLCLVGLYFHLSHGASSFMQTLGLNDLKFEKGIKIFGIIYAVIISVGFASQPIFVFFFYK